MHDPHKHLFEQGLRDMQNAQSRSADAQRSRNAATQADRRAQTLRSQSANASAAGTAQSRRNQAAKAVRDANAVRKEADALQKKADKLENRRRNLLRQGQAQVDSFVAQHTEAARWMSRFTQWPNPLPEADNYGNLGQWEDCNAMQVAVEMRFHMTRARRELVWVDVDEDLADTLLYAGAELRTSSVKSGQLVREKMGWLPESLAVPADEAVVCGGAYPEGGWVLTVRGLYCWDYREWPGRKTFYVLRLGDLGPITHRPTRGLAIGQHYGLPLDQCEAEVMALLQLAREMT